MTNGGKLAYAWRWIRAGLLRAFAPRGPRRRRVLIGGLLAILTWQAGFSLEDAKFDPTYQNTGGAGIDEDRLFVYFYWYLGIFPMVSSSTFHCSDDALAGCYDASGAPGPFSKRAAKRVVRRLGTTLQMDTAQPTWVAGDRGTVHLYMLDTWLKGAPNDPSVKPFHRFCFQLALGGVFASAWWIRRPLLGALLVLLVGSNPFQLLEVYQRENVFGWTITTALLMLALHLPLMRNKRPNAKWVFAWPVGVGMLMATIRTFRSEPATLLASALIVYATVYGLSRMRRAALAGVLVASFLISEALWDAYFLYKHKQAAVFAAAAGGHPFLWGIRLHHHFWHPIWCGLGDFDTKYGYKWDDQAAVRYARPILERHTGLHVPAEVFGRNHPREDYYDDAKVYRRLPYDLPQYNDVIRDKVLHDIKNDPKWYLDILGKRAWRVLTESTPLRLTHRGGWLDLPMPGKGLAFIPLLVLTLLARASFLTKLLAFTLPTCVTAMVIFSDLGPAYYAIFQHVTAAALLILGVHSTRWLYERWERERRGREEEPLSV